MTSINTHAPWPGIRSRILANDAVSTHPRSSKPNRRGSGAASHLHATRVLLLPFRWILPVGRRTRTRGAHEQLAPIRERDVPAVRSPDRMAGVVLGHEALDRHLGTRLH